MMALHCTAQTHYHVWVRVLGNKPYLGHTIWHAHYIYNMHTPLALWLQHSPWSLGARTHIYVRVRESTREYEHSQTVLHALPVCG